MRSILGQQELIEIQQWILNYLPYFLLVFAVMVLIALTFFINLNFKMSKSKKRYEKLMTGMEGANLEQLLENHISEVRQLRGQVAQLTQQVEELTAVSRVCVQKVGVVRFRAFEDTGSDLSFAVALLDSEDNGVVLSSLFGRTESRVYAKPVEHGASSYLLSTEENEALSKAKKQTLIN